MKGVKIMKKNPMSTVLAAVVLSSLIVGCQSTPFEDVVAEVSAASNQVAQLDAWFKTRDCRDLKRYDTPRMKAFQLWFQDYTTNGTFNVNLYFETNQLNVIVGEGLHADEKAKDFDHYCALINRGGRFWHWLRDHSTGALVIQCTIKDFSRIGKDQPNLTSSLVEIAEDQCRDVFAVMWKLKNGELTPDEAYHASPCVERVYQITEPGDPSKVMDEVYQPLWDALQDKEPVKWDGKHRFPIQFDLGLTTNVTKSAISTNVTCLIRADRNLVECLMFRPWGEEDNLEKLAPLTGKCNQMRGDGRWACVEGGHFCIRGAYPLAYVLEDPKRFVREFVIASVCETLSHDDELRLLIECE